FLFHDERALNLFEDRMERRVEALPAGQRLINALHASPLRADGLSHMVGRICVGRCYSYAHYEASTAQVRARVVGGNTPLVSTYTASGAWQTGTYQVQARDLPLYEITLDKQGRMVTLSLKAGAVCGITEWNPL